jgi:hypothetical protein
MSLIKNFINDCQAQKLEPFNSLQDIPQNVWDIILSDHLKNNHKEIYQTLMLTRLTIYKNEKEG